MKSVVALLILAVCVVNATFPCTKYSATQQSYKLCKCVDKDKCIAKSKQEAKKGTVCGDGRKLASWSDTKCCTKGTQLVHSHDPSKGTKCKMDGNHPICEGLTDWATANECRLGQCNEGAVMAGHFCVAPDSEKKTPGEINAGLCTSGSVPGVKTFIYKKAIICPGTFGGPSWHPVCKRTAAHMDDYEDDMDADYYDDEDEEDDQDADESDESDEGTANAQESYYDLMAEFEYDLAVEKAREKYEMQLLREKAQEARNAKMNGN